ncbi:MAG: hypothetical protein ACI9MR_000108 [Myxococcota bacterium]|jgi:hypothetical protein
MIFAAVGLAAFVVAMVMLANQLSEGASKSPVRSVPPTEGEAAPPPPRPRPAEGAQGGDSVGSPDTTPSSAEADGQGARVQREPQRAREAQTTAVANAPTTDVAGTPMDAVTADPIEGGLADERLIYATESEGIRAAMDSAKPAIRECYAGWLKANPDLAGRLVVTFTLALREDPAPNEDWAVVTNVAIPDSSLDHGFLEGCVKNAVSELRFEVPEGALQISYPFAFAQE